MSSRAEWDLKVHERAVRGNAEALDFLHKWALHIHDLDDVVDLDATGHEAFLKTHANSIELYTHPFFLKNINALRHVALHITSVYCDTVDFERSGVAWKEQWANHHRHCGKWMVEAVALICGGYDNLRAISQELSAMCWTEFRIGEENPNQKVA